MSKLKGPPPAPKVIATPARKTSVLFVCIGNCIRSQFAEAFARSYGADVIEAFSCGVAPAGYIAEPVGRILRERGIALGRQASKTIYEAGLGPYDVVINLSGSPLPRNYPTPARDWPVPDPMGSQEEAYRAAAQDIETRVMQLILEMRNSKGDR